MHLSIAAYVSAAGRSIPLGEDSASAIAGWNPDETYWLTDGSPQPATRTSWMIDEMTERWHAIAGR